MLASPMVEGASLLPSLRFVEPRCHGCPRYACCDQTLIAYDAFNDPVDLCQKHGLCGKIRNIGGAPFWFGLHCNGGGYDSYTCKK